MAIMAGHVMTNKPHVHAALIKAWADGAVIECFQSEGDWYVINQPTWSPHLKYRIKPEPKPDFVEYAILKMNGDYDGSWTRMQYGCNLKATFDGETGKLKSVELL